MRQERSPPARGQACRGDQISVIPAKAGLIRLERIWTTEGRPEGKDTWMYPAIQSEAVSNCLSLDPRLRGDDM